MSEDPIVSPQPQPPQRPSTKSGADAELPDHIEEALERAFAGNHESRQELIDALLEKHQDYTPTLQSRIQELWELDQGTITMGTDSHHYEWHETPERIGPYRILATLGTGGMGVVYLAEQLAPVQRDVALKVIKLGMDSKEVLARFEVERQALGMMSHPGIAKVFDAGVSEQGQPYFVMEYARGVSLTEFCDEHQLTVTGRIHIFQQICMAVQHAHQKGVLHRDLKPANILCTREGVQPVVKIIDFGLARAIDQESLERTMYTEEGKMVGTPEYMSPEQARGNTAGIDTRTDVYSLGVILYQLLSGVLPFRRHEFRGVGLLEIYRIIQELEPVRPSSRIVSGDDATMARARNRKLSPAGLRKTLHGELDWIVMRAMAKEPERRYDSATALAMDLRRYLRHEPVDAGPPGPGYRFDRFVRRYRGQLFAVAVMFAIGVFSLLMIWSYAVDAYEQLEVAKNAELRATANEKEAMRQADRARAAVRSASVKDRDLREARALAARREAEINALHAEIEKERGRLAAAQKQSWERASVIELQRQTLEKLEKRKTELETARDALADKQGAIRDLEVAHRLETARTTAAALGPAWPKAIPDFEAWLQEGGSVVAELPRVQSWIAEEQGRPEGSAIVNASTARLDRLRRLESDLTSFRGADGDLARIHRQLEWARRIASLCLDDEALRDAWKLARESIQKADGVVASLLYRAEPIELKPQMGLLPLGMNSRTKLWEFYHLRSAWTPRSQTRPDDVPRPKVARADYRYRGELGTTVHEGIVFVLIPGGTVTWAGIGKVRLAPFFLAKHELTQSQWLNLNGFASPSEYAPGSPIPTWSVTVTGQHPVENVSWQQSRRSLRQHGLDLPTEMQWEYACWAGDHRRTISTPDKFLRIRSKPIANVLDQTAKDDFVGPPATFHDHHLIHAPVGVYPPNGFGLHDMLGNVEEWCLDEYGGYELPVVGVRAERSVNRGDGGPRVVRGGSYRDTPSRALPHVRSRDLPENRHAARGLRAMRRLY